MSDFDNAPISDVPVAATAIPARTEVSGPVVKFLDLPVKIMDIRNGSIADIVSAAPREFIPSHFKWCTIAGVSKENAVDLVEYVIRAQYMTLRTGLSESNETRTKAIVLGSIRAACQVSFALSSSDIETREATGSGFTIVSKDDKMYLEKSANLPDKMSDAWDSWTELTTAEKRLVAAMLYVGIGVLPLQGLSLIKYQHHYLSNAGEGPKKPWLALMKQVKAAVSPEVTAVMNEEWFGDIAFHKAGHPVKPALKQGFARDPAIKDKLKAANLGSAAVRLPATPPDLEIARAALSILIEAKPTLEAIAKTVDVENLRAAVSRVDVLPLGAELNEAVKHAVGIVDTHAPRIAYAAGVVRRIHEESSPSSLLSAYSIKRLVADYADMDAQGYRARGALNTLQVERLRAGEFVPEIWSI